jgi:hypothetical protein
MDQVAMDEQAIEVVRPTTRIDSRELQEHIAKTLAQSPVKKDTGELDRRKLDAFPSLSSSPYGLGVDSAAGFIPLPLKAEQRRSTTWLIELQGLGREALGIHLLGDVVLGLARPNCTGPDLDLANYDAETKGVSRRHAVLRPSQNRLFVIDLQSTNGTLVNMMPVYPGIAKEMRHNDTISLGALSFTVKIIATPDQLQALRNARTA